MMKKREEAMEVDKKTQINASQYPVIFLLC